MNPLNGTTSRYRRTEWSVLAFACLAAFVVVGATSGHGPLHGGHRLPSSRLVTPSRESAYRANNLGVARLEQFDYDGAAREFRRALEVEPNLVMAQMNLGLALYYGNQPDEATAAALRALQLSPDAVQAVYLLGLLAKDRNQPEEAVRHFTRILAIDPSDVGSRVNLGQVYVQQRKFSEAVELFREALVTEPYNVTAAYNLAVALTRAGQRDEGQRAMQQFQALRDSAYGTTYSRIYLEQGRYAEAVVSTGAEPELVDLSEPEVTFNETTRDMFSAAPDVRDAVAVTLFDADRDGDLDLVVIEPQSANLYLNERGRLSLSRGGIRIDGSARPGSLGGALAGDYDNDGRPDLFLLRQGGNRLLQQQPDGTFHDVSGTAKIPQNAMASRAAAFVDVDHDGDLDIFVSGMAELRAEESSVDLADLTATRALPPALSQLLRNNGNGTFVDVAADAGVATAGHVVGIVPTDFDNRRDIDLLLASLDGRPILFRNLRDGSFRDDAEALGLTREGKFTCLTVADVNKDGFPDAFFGRIDGTGLFAMSDGHGRFVLADGPAASAEANAAAFVDYDQDGLLDLIILSRGGPRIFRNVGRSWADMSDRAFEQGGAIRGQAAAAMALGDLDLDGDVDLVVIVGGHVEIWRNVQGNLHRSVAVGLTATVSNRSGLGSKVEMRAGSLRQVVEVTSTTPAVGPADLSFGLGPRDAADVVRVLWPAGILQAETDFQPVSPGGPGVPRRSTKVSVTELNRKPSSCPYLYTWDGERFQFVTDFMGGGEMGTWIAPGVRNVPDPDEYVRIRSDQLRVRDGYLDIRVTNELEEALFLDRLELVAVDHPQSVEVYPNEGLLPPPRPAFRLTKAAKSRPPAAIRDDHGHDVLDRVLRLDRRYPDDFALDSLRGYAREHALVLDLGDHLSATAVLLLTGWTDYAFSGDNLAAYQSGLAMRPPELQVRDGRGQWQTTISRIPFPVGRPQTIVVDLSSLPRPLREIRIVTNMRIYWDQILVTEADAATPSILTRLGPALAQLRWRGYSQEDAPDGREPFRYVYERVSPFSPWKVMPGRYTREGDVKELVKTSDDRFVVSRPGDEIAVAFGAASLPPLDPGWTRTFLLYTDGFTKEMDLNSASPDQVAPLPFHGMSSYPERPPDSAFETRRRADIDEYNTRIVLRMVPPLEFRANTVTP